jgi:hypothetical protein
MSRSVGPAVRIRTWIGAEGGDLSHTRTPGGTAGAVHNPCQCGCA